MDLDIQEIILAHTFNKYLSDIIALEIQLVNHVCDMIINDVNLPIKFSDQAKTNAITVLIDEYYHVYIARDISKQINSKLKFLSYTPKTDSDATRAVARIKSLLQPKYHNIFEIIAVCIFETSLIQELVEFFNNNDVQPSVRQYVNDHMNDEAKHAGFFKYVLEYTWSNITKDFQDNIGYYIPKFLVEYLNMGAKKEFCNKLLYLIIKKENSDKIVNDVFSKLVITPQIPLVKSIMTTLKNCNLLNNDNIIKEFKHIGWEIQY